MLDATEAVRHIGYDPKTGVFTSTKTGKRVGYRHSRGYIRVHISGRAYLAHRLAWLIVFGSWPSKQIDHINGDQGDNRIENLRDVSSRLNNQNRRGATPNTVSGLRGVSWHKRNKRWQAKIRDNYKTIWIGSFLDKEEAFAAYVAAKRRLHEGCTI